MGRTTTNRVRPRSDWIRLCLRKEQRVADLRMLRGCTSESQRFFRDAPGSDVREQPSEIDALAAQGAVAEIPCAGGHLKTAPSAVRTCGYDPPDPQFHGSLSIKGWKASRNRAGVLRRFAIPCG